MPLTGLVLPSSESSPTKALFSRWLLLTWPESANTARAIGRSRCEPSLVSSAGAKFTVTFLAGKTNPEFVIARRTRSRASDTVLDAIPTILNAGRDLLLSASTSTTLPSYPSGIAEYTFAIISSLYSKFFKNNKHKRL